METVFRRLTAPGYRRPGLAMAMESDPRAGHNWPAAFWSEQRTLSARNRLPLLQKAPFTRDAFRRWFNRHRQDGKTVLAKTQLEATSERPGGLE